MPGVCIDVYMSFGWRYSPVICRAVRVLAGGQAVLSLRTQKDCKAMVLPFCGHLSERSDAADSFPDHRLEAGELIPMKPCM